MHITLQYSGSELPEQHRFLLKERFRSLKRLILLLFLAGAGLLITEIVTRGSYSLINTGTGKFYFDFHLFFGLGIGLLITAAYLFLLFRKNKAYFNGQLDRLFRQLGEDGEFTIELTNQSVSQKSIPYCQKIDWHLFQSYRESAHWLLLNTAGIYSVMIDTRKLEPADHAALLARLNLRKM